jgi:glycerol-3-phosphate acyltransferase PlsY
MPSEPLPLIAALLFGYVLGSIPFGLVLTRLAGLEDVRTIGSGNIGATNVLRTGNKPLAAATLVLDALKGTAAVLGAPSVAGGDAALAAALGAFLGHVFPVWLRFKGGKGVATYLGALLGVAPLVALVFATTWLVIAAIFRLSSLSALAASVAAPVALFAYGERAAVIFALMSALLWFNHRANIARLIAGTEPRIGART